jgi:hypothetical protein
VTCEISSGIARSHYILIIKPMEDAMKPMEDAMNPDANSLYILFYSLTATVISLPAVWYFAAAAYAAPGLVA